MTAVIAAAAALVLTVLLLAMHHWRSLAERERMRERVGVAQPRRPRFARTDALLTRLPGVRGLARTVSETGLAISPTDLLLLHIPLGYLALLTGERLWGPTLGRPVAVAGLLMTTWLLVDRLAARRRQRLLSQVPDLVRLLAAGARAGLSITGALAEAANDIADPTAAELHRVVVAVELGKPVTDALEEFAARLAAPELDIVISALAIQQRSGGDLVNLLSRLALGLEAMQRGRNEVRSITAGLGAQAYLGLAMGLGGAALMNRITDGGLEDAMDKPITAAVILVSVLLLLVAAPILRRITRITP